jgi:hypothetical protein
MPFGLTAPVLNRDLGVTLKPMEQLAFGHRLHKCWYWPATKGSNR